MAVSMLLLVAGLVAALTGPGLCCRDKEYETSTGECCPMCYKGTVVRRDCTQESGTRCRPCDTGTYMNQPSGLAECFRCTSCLAANGLYVQQTCTATSDTVCGVLSGHFCRSLTEDSGCSLAVKHSRCSRGQRIKEPGTNRTDTVCEDCQPGYFSKDGVMCAAWTMCSENQVKVKDGGPGHDVVCRSASGNNDFLFMPLLLFLSLTVLWQMVT